jgi:hypothetical protein
MSFSLRICKNPTTDLLRDTFKATPVNPPESSVQPLLVFALKPGGSAQKRGHFQHLLADDAPLQLEVSQNRVSDTALERTQSVDLDFGINIMEALLKGFKIDAAPVNAALKNARQISFSFTNIYRHSIDINQLGKQLIGRHLDIQNPALSIFTDPTDPWQMLLVTDVLVSNEIAINAEKSTDGSLDINLEALQAYITGANLKVKASKKQGDTIVFEGEEQLTFAFSCVRVIVEAGTGRLGLGETINPRSGRGGEYESAREVTAPVEYAELDEDARRPGFFSFEEA